MENEPWFSQTVISEWKDSKRHGLGAMTFANGIKYMGEWKDDIFISTSKPYLANVIS
jgi:hypothetical protein